MREAREKNAPLNEKTKEHLSKVLDTQPKTGWGSSHWDPEDTREQELSSSPRVPAQWKLDKEEEGANVVKLPMAIDWDLLEDGPDKDGTHGGVKDIAKLVLEPPEEDLSTSQKPQRPSAAFQSPSRDDVYSARSTVAASEPGRYEPKWKSVRRREPAALIVDRGLFRTRTMSDGRDFVEPELRSHVPSVHMSTHTSRATPNFGRLMSKVSMAEQKAIFGSTVDHGYKDVMYDTSTYWEQGPGKQHIGVPNMALSEGRKDAKADGVMMAARSYPSVSTHASWVSKSPLLKTVADMGYTADMSRMVGRAEFYRENKDTERVDFRQHEPYVEEGVGNVSKLKGIVPISKMVARDRTAEAIRASQTKAASPDKFGLQEDPTLLQSYKVVPFAKLLPRDSGIPNSAAPDTVYNTSKALERIEKSRASAPQFSKMTARTAMESPPPPSVYMSYPAADKPRLHSPTVDLSRSQGHGSLIDKGHEWSATQDVPGRVPLSSTGSKVQASGYAWHPSDTPLGMPHVASPDLAGGGKSRPSMARKVGIDKLYDTDKALAMTERRPRNVMIGSGPAGQGRQADEMKAERVRLEEEIRVIIQSKPPSKIMPH